MTRLGFGTLTLVALVSTNAAPRNDGALEWLDDYDEAIALAKDTGRPLWLEFRCAP